MSAVDELSREKKEELILNIQLEDIKMRNQDRCRIGDDNYSNYKLIVLIILGSASVALGGSSFSSLHEIANTVLFFLAAFCFVISIILILIELNISYNQGLQHEAELAKNDGLPVTAPDNGAILCLLWVASSFDALGLFLLLIATAVGK